MKLRKCARLLLAVTPLLAGCGNFWQPPDSTGSGGGTTTTLSGGYFYVTNQATMQLVAYDINSGSLNKIGAYSLAAAPYAVAIAPNGSLLYVSTIAGIYLYNIGSGGGLTIGNSGGVISSDPASSMVVDTSGSWLVDAVQGTAGVQVDAIPITSSGIYTGGTVGSQQYALTNATVHQLALSSDDLNVFVASGQGGTLVIPFNSSSTNPLGSRATVVAVSHSDGSALSVAVDPTLRLFYIGETLASGGTTGGLRVFNYSSLGGSLTQATGSPIASGGNAPQAILPIASGDYVYVGNGVGLSSAGNVTGFSIASASGAYTIAQASTVSAGIQPYGLAEDSSANFVVAVSEGGSPDLEAYIFDTTTAGQLDSVVKSATGTDPTQAVAVAAIAP
ncbi:MAG TPA: beta-propeller fold lactonase family protein [Terracidiphilus sp.]|jgi:6-phosphogluconolactonase (cycloisomerase 2 family)|nr:beta-propeller fold lactonase family protein [Terracidiphilus sp.]